MDYSSLAFLILLPFAIGIYFGIPDRFKYIWLLVLSYLFCFSWGTRAVIFLFSVTMFSYGAGLFIDYFSEKSRIKRVALVLGILGCIGFWVFSKGGILLFSFPVRNNREVFNIAGRNFILFFTGSRVFS